MSAVVINGDTSGSITLQAPAVAGTNTLTLPASTGTVALLQTPSFATTIGVGGATPSASGAGITFPASQSASTDANTLDDYEEGTWTPSLGGTATYNSADTFGFYTKIGNLVTVHWSISVNTIGTGQVYGIVNLPFTSAAKSQFGTVGNFSGINNSVGWLYSYTDPSSTTMFFGGSTSFTTGTAVPLALMKNSALAYGTFTYRVA